MRSTRLASIVGVLALAATILSPAWAVAASPSARDFSAMAYDAAHAQDVLFGGHGVTADYLSDTWTWDGIRWRQQHPTHVPPARFASAMAYDAADGQVVLFGGAPDSTSEFALRDTWTWDGTDWTQQFPAHSPPRRIGMGMAFDAATGQVVLFGGNGRSSTLLNDTWTWNGTDWTRLLPAHRPGVRAGMGMAYDVARSQIVLFGGGTFAGDLGDTWTWDGTDWTHQTPARSPSARGSVPLAGDDALGRVVLFGGVGTGNTSLGDTWTWDGTDWTRRTPAHHPSVRAAMDSAVDALGHVMMFGGGNGTNFLGDTWTWDGTDWTVPVAATLTLTPSSGSPGTAVQVQGSGFGGSEKVTLAFVDAVSGTTALKTITSDGTGSFSTGVVVPANASSGDQIIDATAKASGQNASATFTVT
jgi:hypothetical protein